MKLAQIVITKSPKKGRYRVVLMSSGKTEEVFDLDADGVTATLKLTLPSLRCPSQSS